jgi:hypothetical protein
LCPSRPPLREHATDRIPDPSVPRLDSVHQSAENAGRMAVKLDRPRSKRMPAGDRRPRRPDRLSEVATKILHYANRGLPHIDFLREVSKMLMELSGCDALELRVKDPKLQYRWEASKQPRWAFRFVILEDSRKENHQIPNLPPPQNGSGLERVCQDVLLGRFETRLPFSTRQRSFWTGDTHKPIRLRRAGRIVLGGLYRSLAVIRFTVEDRTVGLLQLKSLQPDHFTRDEVESYEGFAQTLGLAIANRRVQWALRERVKELTCLYGIAQVAQRPGLSLEEILQGIVELLPPAWQHPEIATARILLDGRARTTADFKEGPHRQVADIFVGGVRRGVVEVFYTRDKGGLWKGRS